MATPRAIMTTAKIVFTSMANNPRTTISREAYRAKRLLLTLGLLISDVQTFAEP